MRQVDTSTHPQVPANPLQHSGTDSMSQVSVAATPPPAATTPPPSHTQPAAVRATQSAATPATPPATVREYFFYDTSQHFEIPEPQEADTLAFNIDSVLAACQGPAPFPKKSLFTEHSLQSSHSRVAHAIAPHAAPNWIFGVIILFVAIISLLVNNYKFRVNTIFQASVDNRGLNRLFHENNFNHGLALIPMAVIYIASLALMVFRLSTGDDIASWAAMGRYLLILAACMAFYFARNGLIQLFGTIFENTDTTTLYLSNTYIYNFMGGIVVMPFMLLLFYSGLSAVVVYVLLSVVAILFVMRLGRGLQLVLSTAKNSRLYLFYYLCIFEIVPFLILAKILFL